MGFLDSLGSSKATWLAIIIWTIGLILAVAAALEARNKADDRTKINLVEYSTPAKLVIKPEKVSDKEYEKSVKGLRKIHPTVKFDTGRRVKGGGMRVYIPKEKDNISLASYYSFIFVLYDVMISIPDARWSLKELCVGEGCKRHLYSAHLEAERKKSTLVSGQTSF